MNLYKSMKIYQIFDRRKHLEYKISFGGPVPDENLEGAQFIPSKERPPKDLEKLAKTPFNEFTGLIRGKKVDFSKNYLKYFVKDRRQNQR